MADLMLVLPEQSEDALSDGLRALTAIVCTALCEEGGFGLGGEFGYGVIYENDVFSMHPNCWCDSEECPWCSYSNEHGRYFQERHRVHGAVPEFGCGAAPNFWHKPSGFKVWWYKWIGRDMEANQPCALGDVLRECAASVAPPLH